MAGGNKPKSYPMTQHTEKANQAAASQLPNMAAGSNDLDAGDPTDNREAHESRYRTRRLTPRGRPACHTPLALQKTNGRIQQKGPF